MVSKVVHNKLSQLRGRHDTAVPPVMYPLLCIVYRTDSGSFVLCCKYVQRIPTHLGLGVACKLQAGWAFDTHTLAFQCDIGFPIIMYVTDTFNRRMLMWFVTCTFCSTSSPTMLPSMLPSSASLRVSGSKAYHYSDVSIRCAAPTHLSQARLTPKQGEGCIARLNY